MPRFTLLMKTIIKADVMKKAIKILVPVIGAVAVGMFLKHKYFANGEDNDVCECPKCGCVHSTSCGCHSHGCMKGKHGWGSKHEQASLLEIKQMLEEKLEAIKEKLSKSV